MSVPTFGIYQTFNVIGFKSIKVCIERIENFASCKHCIYQTQKCNINQYVKKTLNKSKIPISKEPVLWQIKQYYAWQGKTSVHLIKHLYEMRIGQSGHLYKKGLNIFFVVTSILLNKS